MKVNFIYQTQKFQVDLEVFNKYSDYFSEKKIKIIDDDQQLDLFLVSEFEDSSAITIESINQFFKYFQNLSLNLDLSNIIGIQYLSTKFGVSKLMKETEKYISTNIKSVIDMIFEKECFNQQTECIFVKHLPKIIQDDRLNRLPISTLFRILNSYTKRSKQEPKNVQFILISSILLTTIEHSEENLEYIKQNVNKYKNIVKYPEFQSILIEYLIQDNQKSKEKYDKKIENIRKEFQKNLMILFHIFNKKSRKMFRIQIKKLIK